MDPRRQFAPRPSDDPHYFGTGDAVSGGTAFTGQTADEMEERQIVDDLPSDGAQPSLERAAAASTHSDARIQEEISRRLSHARQIDVSAVTVAVEGGQVRFDGSVRDLATKHQIEELANACPGVQDVQNRVRVTGGA